MCDSTLNHQITTGRAYHIFRAGIYTGMSFFFPDSASKYRDAFEPSGEVRYLTNLGEQKTA